MREVRVTRRGLVLGAGGLLGFAWSLGALVALRDATGAPPGDADVLVGTSAGSVLAALLGAGLDLDAALRNARGALLDDDPLIEYDPSADRAVPPRPGWGIGSGGLLLRVARHPRRYPPMTALASVLPPGRRTADAVGRLVDQVVPTGEWAPHPATWIVAMDYASGRRVPFGRPGAPRAGLAEAVMASCAIPGWYAPVTIGGRRYVDGGTCSATSVDLLAGAGLDDVVVLAPMASFEYDAPGSVAGRFERRWRRATTRRLAREVELVRRGGAAVTVLTPGPEDLAAIGPNLMDPARRDLVLETALRTTAAALRRGDALAG